ncbi:MAG: hypothetical protein ABSF18_04395 [Gammaproteobacteria bacterium]
MHKIDTLDAVITDSSQTIKALCEQTGSELNPIADLCQHIYEEILKNYPNMPDNIQIKHLNTMLAAEFYHEQCAQMGQARDLKIFYQTCKNEIDTQFNEHPVQARFLHLMIMLELIDKPQTPITLGHIKAALTLFRTELFTNATPKILSDFEDYFATVKMPGFKSLDAFIDKIESFLNPGEAKVGEVPSSSYKFS